jgi:hypothetical protein
MNTHLRDNQLASVAGEAFQVWSPILLFASNGDGTLTGRYLHVGYICWIELAWTLGSSSTVSAGFSVTPPVNAAASMVNLPVEGAVAMVDTGTTTNIAYMIAVSASRFRFFVVYVAGTYATIGAGADGSTPFTWTNGDQLHLTGMYHTASQA